MKTLILSIAVALAFAALAWVTAQMFDRAERPRTRTRYFMGKIIPLALGAMAIGAAVAGVIVSVLQQS